MLLEQPVRARLDASGHQVVEVAVQGGYQPALIRALAGLPLRLVFHRQDDDACSERVVFSAPRIDRRLTPTGSTTIDLPAHPPGEIRFTCGMGRYRGQIEFVDERRPSTLTRALDQTARLKVPHRATLVMRILSLPLLALVAVLVLDMTAAVAALGAAVVACVAGCLWASRRSARSVQG